MRLVITDEAARDFEHIGDVIARDNPTRAKSFVRELNAACESLLVFPRRFLLVGKRSGTHKMTHGNYLIYYRVTGDIVEVLSVRHAARRQPRFR